MLIEIKHWLNGKVIYTGEFDSVKLAMEAAVRTGADLTGAYLKGADLTGADLTGAYLTGAYLTKGPPARIDTGETWEEYTKQVVPALLIAGGKSLASFAEAWRCHTWTNCPMAHAFDVHDIDQVPILLRPRAEQFVMFFDAGWLKAEELGIPMPVPDAPKAKKKAKAK